MKNQIAVALVHGIGKVCPEFADVMIRNLRRYLGAQADYFVFEPVHWAPVAQECEIELWKRLRFGKMTRVKKWWHFKFSRKFMINSVGDGIAYQPIKNEKGMYDEIHRIYALVLKKLAVEVGARVPLCVISHSLGTIISSNYFYDLQDKTRLVSDKVKEVMGDTELERGETLTNYYTMGSPIALWSLRYPDFGQPIKFPGTTAEIEKMCPGLRDTSEWINIFNKNIVWVIYCNKI